MSPGKVKRAKAKNVKTKILGQRERVFIDFQHKKLNLGRVYIELFSDILPITCKNFRALCTGENGLAKSSNIPLCYRHSIVHRIIPGFVIQGGDFTLGNGRGGESIYPGGQFDDEKLDILKHEKPMYVSMANSGPNSNGSQFFITLAPTPHLDGKHQIFGRVIKGENVVLGFQNIELSGEKPIDDLVIVNCGQMVKKQDVKKGSSDSDSDSEDGGKSKKKKKKKDKKKKKKKDKKKEQKDSGDEDETESEDEENEAYCSVDPSELPPEPVNYYLDRDAAYKLRKEQEAENEKLRAKDAKKEAKRLKKEAKKSGKPVKQEETPDFRYVNSKLDSRAGDKRPWPIRREPSPPRNLTNAELRAMEADSDRKSHLETGRTTTSSRYKSEGSFRFRLEDETAMKNKKVFKNKRELAELAKRKEMEEEEKKVRAEMELEGTPDEHGLGKIVDPEDREF